MLLPPVGRPKAGARICGSPSHWEPEDTGHDITRHGAKGVESVKAILIDRRTGVLMGAAAPATDSYAIGW